jgi:hypothetical protein
MRMGIIDFTTGNRLASDLGRQSVADWSLEHSTREAFHGALEAWANAGLPCRDRGNETPMLVIPGEHDPALGEATVRQTWEPHFPNCHDRGHAQRRALPDVRDPGGAGHLD